jgi:release factor glutamine methyltransferase
MDNRALIDIGAERLEAAGVETPRLDAELLLAEAAGVTRSEILAGLTELTPSAIGTYEKWLVRREAREPLAYIVGRQGFRHIDLVIDPRVLIPRPETELLVELVAAAAPLSVLDVATGSGAVALALADELETAAITACDVSADAIVVARANAERLGLSRVKFVESDLLDAIDGGFDAIVANLPYVESGDIDGLQREVAEFEPRLALDGGDDGLDLVRELVRQAPDHLAPGGLIALEIGLGQAPATEQILAENGFVKMASHRDLAGIERVVSARLDPGRQPTA